MSIDPAVYWDEMEDIRHEWLRDQAMAFMQISCQRNNPNHPFVHLTWDQIQQQDPVAATFWMEFSKWRMGVQGRKTRNYNKWWRVMWEQKKDEEKKRDKWTGRCFRKAWWLLRHQ